MKLGSTILCLVAFSCLSISLIAQTVSGQKVETGSSEELRPGVVIESVSKNSEAEKAGLQQDDLVLHWSRGDSNGQIESPFDLWSIEIEQAPQGTVTLEGVTASQGHRWAIGPSTWGIVARPNFAEPLLSSYKQARDLAAAGQTTRAAELWRAAAAQTNQRPWLSAWFLLLAAEALSNDKQWKEADAAYEAAILLSRQSGPTVPEKLLRSWAATYQQRSDWASAERCYLQAITEHRKLGVEDLTTAGNLNSLGRLAWQRGDLDKAEEYLTRALAMSERLVSDNLNAASILNSLGVVARARGDLTKSAKYHHQALTIRERLAPGSLDVAISLNNLGNVAWRQGDLTEADQQYGRALNIFEKLAPGGLYVASTLDNLGMVADDQGNLAKGEDYHRRALAVFAPGSLDAALCLNNLGSIARERGDLALAERYYFQALTIRKKLAPGSLDVAASLNNVGLLMEDRSDLAKAEEYLREALAIKEKKAPNSLDVASSLDILGTIVGARGDLGKAEEYFREALRIKQKRAPNSLEVASGFRHLGTVAHGRGDLAKTEQYYREALAITEKLAPGSIGLASTLEGLADVAKEKGNLAQAEEGYRQALAIWDRLAPGAAGHAEVLAALASIVRYKQPEAAAQLFSQAVSALESQTARLGGSEDDRSGYRSQFLDYYRDYVDLLINREQPDQALEVLERSRARTLLEMLAQGHIDVHKGIDQDLLERERSVAADLRAKFNRRIQLLTRQSVKDQLAAIDGEIEKLLAQHKDLEEQIRVSSPGYATLTQPEALGAKQIQALLDSDTLLLEYSLGKHSYVFAVSSNVITAHALPEQSSVEQAARLVYELLAASNRAVTGENAAQRRSRLAKAESQYPIAANHLSRMILGPVAAQLNKKRLLIVADGALHSIPFAALSLPDKPGLPLITEHEVINLPSASVLSVLRQQQEERKPGPDVKEVAVLADPVFDKGDERVTRLMAVDRQAVKEAVKETRRGPQAMHEGEMAAAVGDGIAGSEEETFSERLLTRSATDLGFTQQEKVFLPRLLHSREEARSIVAVTPVGQAMQALDFRASRAMATSPELAQYRIVHFATHGLIDSKHPELSGLVWSMVDARGKPQNGFLGLEDIYNMNLPVDLVVLSACDTGLGKQISGEGVIGLTRGFMYAGASRVVASLWGVEDMATAELMSRFYRVMEKQGMRPAAALRQAQIEMWKRDYQPHTWAAFQIYGEWK